MAMPSILRESVDRKMCRFLFNNFTTLSQIPELVLSVAYSSTEMITESSLFLYFDFLVEMTMFFICRTCSFVRSNEALETLEIPDIVDCDEQSMDTSSDESLKVLALLFFL